MQSILFTESVYAECTIHYGSMYKVYFIELVKNDIHVLFTKLVYYSLS